MGFVSKLWNKLSMQPSTAQKVLPFIAIAGVVLGLATSQVYRADLDRQAQTVGVFAKVAVSTNATALRNYLARLPESQREAVARTETGDSYEAVVRKAEQANQELSKMPMPGARSAQLMVILLLLWSVQAVATLQLVVIARRSPAIERPIFIRQAAVAVEPEDLHQGEDGHFRMGPVKRGPRTKSGDGQ